MFSKMNINFFNDARNVTFKCISLGKDYLSFFWQKGNIIFVTFIHITENIIFPCIFFIFHFPYKQSNFREGKKKYHLFRYFKKHIPVRLFLERPSFQNIRRKCHISKYFFLRKRIFPFPSKE